jgi:GDP-L-fucose synthase
MNSGSRIYVAGHRGMVGSALVRLLEARGFGTILTKTRAELDLRDYSAVQRFFREEKPEYVFLAAATVGGILANMSRPAEFFFDNLAIATNVIHCAWRHGAKRLLNLGSSCIYPRDAPQPLREEYLLSAPLEPTNEAYAIAKIAALKMCAYYNEQYRTDFFSLMPCNLYGPNDNFDLTGSHVLPALIRKFHEAKVRGGPVEAWGDGTPRREFLHVDDLAEAALAVAGRESLRDLPLGFLNAGSGRELSIRELASLVADITGYRGDVVWDASRPNGTPRKILDSSRLLSLGWKPRIDLASGIAATYQWFLDGSVK